MGTEYHYGEEHIFTSRKAGGNINIGPGVGETLTISGASLTGSAAGSTNSIQYNVGGNFTGDTELTYIYPPGILTSPSMILKGSLFGDFNGTTPFKMEVGISNDTKLINYFGDLTFENRFGTLILTNLNPTGTITLSAPEGVRADCGITSANAYGYASGRVAQSIPDITNTSLTTYYGNAVVLTGSTEEAPTYLNGTFTITKSGLYQITASIYIETAAGGIRIGSIRKNGTTVLSTDIRDPVSGNKTNLHMSSTVELVATDTIDTTIYQSSGGALAMDTVYLGEFSVYRLK